MSQLAQLEHVVDVGCACIAIAEAGLVVSAVTEHGVAACEVVEGVEAERLAHDRASGPVTRQVGLGVVLVLNRVGDLVQPVQCIVAECFEQALLAVSQCRPAMQQVVVSPHQFHRSRAAAIEGHAAFAFTSQVVVDNGADALPFAGAVNGGGGVQATVVVIGESGGEVALCRGLKPSLVIVFVTGQRAVAAAAGERATLQRR